jgi:hypothetical protein
MALPNLGALSLGPPTGPLFQWERPRKRTRRQTAEQQEQEGPQCCPISQEPLADGEWYYTFPGDEAKTAYEIPQIYEYLARKARNGLPLTNPTNSAEVIPPEDWQAIRERVEGSAAPAIAANWRTWVGLSGVQFEAVRFWNRLANGDHRYDWMKLWYTEMRRHEREINRNTDGRLQRAGGFQYTTPFRDGLLEIRWLIDHFVLPEHRPRSTASRLPVEQNMLNVKMVIDSNTPLAAKLDSSANVFADRVDPLRLGMLAMLLMNDMPPEQRASITTAFVNEAALQIAPNDFFVEIVREHDVYNVFVYVSPLVLYGAAMVHAAARSEQGTLAGGGSFFGSRITPSMLTVAGYGVQDGMQCLEARPLDWYEHPEPTQYGRIQEHQRTWKRSVQALIAMVSNFFQGFELHEQRTADVGTDRFFLANPPTRRDFRGGPAPLLTTANPEQRLAEYVAAHAQYEAERGVYRSGAGSDEISYSKTLHVPFWYAVVPRL